MSGYTTNELKYNLEALKINKVIDYIKEIENEYIDFVEEISAYLDTVYGRSSRMEVEEFRDIVKAFRDKCHIKAFELTTITNKINKVVYENLNVYEYGKAKKNLDDNLHILDLEFEKELATDLKDKIPKLRERYTQIKSTIKHYITL